MKQLIPFEKDISFNTRLFEITSISLDHDLSFKDNNLVTGEFYISGKYKINEISRNEEDFKKILDFEISLDDKYDSAGVEISIDNFYYEVINENILRVHIDILVDNLKYLDILEVEEKIDTLDDLPIIKTEKLLEDIDVGIKEIEKEIIEEIEEDKFVAEDNREAIISDNKVSFDFFNEESFTMYKVHILKEDENIDSLCSLYNVSKEEIEKYNNINELITGSKIIIPANNE